MTVAADAVARDWLHSWNPDGLGRYDQVRVEDDVRESLQNVRVHRPTLEQRKQMLELSAQVGVQVTFLGFPAASAAEREQCAALVGHLADKKLPQEPVLMARAVAADVRAVLEIQQQQSAPVTADLYLSSSPIRARVENWSVREMLERLKAMARLAAGEGLDFRIAFEDSTRTPPGYLAPCVKAALDVGAKCVVLNDTAGDCVPAGASRHTEFVADLIAKSGTDTELSWHGHNDKGLALANSLAAIEAGATLISGTFTGLGERTGNTPLEQLLVLLVNAGTPRYDLSQLVPMCELIAAATGVEIPTHLPVVGADAFSTSTGTHATAVLKARALGPDFEDAVYSAVSARRLGREQELLLGPNSSRPAVSAVLDAMALPVTGDDIDALLAHCKQHRRTLRTREDILNALGFVTDPSGPPPSGTTLTSGVRSENRRTV
ncbi:homocitrate synthase [Yinghuangia aomiensis]|uniref:2-isopropylmalate synthase n=1 Tax=Yinghuangia aomiensis TaxID=676205 RepID=A0ABP9IA64_9ACTN